MRKTSQDGGDTTSITSGVENEIKKTGAIIKTKRNSIKRKVQSLSHESDDAVVEPLLQKDKEKTETINQSAKYNLLPKTKTDFKNERESDKAKLLKEDNKEDSLLSDTQNEVNAITPIPSSNTLPKYTSGEAPLHNHMNTNVFNSPDTSKGFLTSKTQVLVEIDASKQSGFSPSPLIFTTAKIHTNDKTKHMQQVTPVPILSTIEVSIKGAKNSSGEPSGSVTSNVSSVPCNIPKSNKNIPEKLQNLKTSTFVPEPANKIVEIKDFSDKNQVTQNNKVKADESAVIKDYKIGSKLPSNRMKDTPLKDGNYMNSKEENEIDGKFTKVSLCHSFGSPTSDEIKSTIPSAVCKSPVSKTPVTAQASSTNYAIKKIPNDKTAQTTKIDETNVLKTSEPETDLNKNITSRVNCAPSQSNKSEATYQDKLVSYASASSKPLQRQKYAIDKEDSTPKLQCSDNDPSASTSQIVIKPHDIGASIIKSATQIKSSANDVNSMNNKTNLPKSTANDVHITSPVSNKLPSGNVTTANKTATLNSFKPIMSPHNIPSSESKAPIAKVKDIPTTLVAQNETIVKPSLNNMITSGIGDELTGSNFPSKPQTSVINNKPLIAVTSSAKMKNVVPMVDISITSPNQAVMNTNITNIPSATSSKVTETILKNPTVSTAKTSPVSTTIAKTLSTPACTINTAPVSTISAKTSPVSISNTTNSSLPATSAMASKAKTTTITTTTINTSPLLTNTAKSSTELKGTGKASPASTTLATGTSVSIPTDKTSNTPTTSDVSHQVTSSSAPTSVIPASTDSTSKALQSHKKSRELTNGNKSLNA